MIGRVCLLLAKDSNGNLNSSTNKNTVTQIWHLEVLAHSLATKQWKYNIEEENKPNK